MPQTLNLPAELAFYQSHLAEALLPFWLTRSIDAQYGGYFTCFANAGPQLLSIDKFTWSQGRMVWVWSKLAGMSMFSAAERSSFQSLARSGAAFLMEHCRLPGGNCTFLMERDGTPKVQAPGLPLDSSIYADCFVVLGLSRYAALSGDAQALAFAADIYGSVRTRLASAVFHSEPYPTPPGYRVHGIPMILLNTSQEMARALAALGNTAQAAEADATASACMSDIVEHFITRNGILHEMIDVQNRFVPHTLLGRYTNPGHTLEDAWFLIHQAQRSGDQAVISQATHIAKIALANGWDHAYGGLLLFVDQDGGPPQGDVAGLEDERMVLKVQADWGSKLWWVHSEALYAALLAYTLTGDGEFADMYGKVKEYTFQTFPNPDPAVGEWIQIRDRQGQPEERVVALPVKDPFHIIRNVALLVDLLDAATSRPQG